MRTSKLSTLVATALTACGALPTAAQEPKPIRIAVNTAVQLQVGRDTVVGVKMAIDAINAKGGLLTRKLEVAVADAGEAVSGGAKMASPPSTSSRPRITSTSWLAATILA
jgi:ABC-type branched-subunit amino acid transport system substrate-binding protein